MTHDELLAEINLASIGEYASLAVALIAVVELHKPTPEGRYPNLLCVGCSMTEVSQYVDYPCRTIRFIEKELA